ncbi:peroxiredoxin family protein [Olleya namhaensis]|uniref:peroxiredoxin family protein n=1 Tax=Olleya namhaensis TaxID=1144750 RepID=UPI0024921FC0|nr:TlpA disulfide reductase family protein [Olleya namhaensis]
MKFLKSIAFLLAFLCFGLLQAQDYKFLPSDQRLLSDEEVKTMEIAITPDVLLYNEKGKLLPMSQVQLMTNSDYKPLFYVDQNKAIKSIVFKRVKAANNVIAKNPEANFTKGEKALDFITTDLDGNTIKLSELKGHVVVLNFWFTKCGPCIKEMPELNKLKTNFKDKKVKFLAITFNSKDLVEQFLEDSDFNFTIAPNANDVITTYGVQSYPTSIVIDKEGHIVAKETGYRTNIKTVLTKAINAAL